MPYIKVKVKKTNQVNRPKYYGGETTWILKDLKTKKENHYKSLRELADKNKKIPYGTWRNIVGGRTNTYDNLYSIKKSK